MSKRLVNLARWLVFALAVLVLNFPVIATAITSLKGEAEITTNASLIIEAPTLANYAAVFAMADRFDILHFLTNSLVASLIGSALAIALAFPAAYAMARFNVGRAWLLPLVVNLRALPLVVFAILLVLSMWMFLYSRRTRVDHSNVNDEWVENATNRTPETAAAARSAR